MVQINFATREVSCKIVYYGPGLCGKTTNLQQVHTKAPTELRGNLTSIATEGDRTLFFDFMPLELGTVAGMRTKLQLYTVPGQVYYNATRKIVLEGVDGVIFVADSSPSRRQANRESWQNLKENLHEYGLDLHDVPLVLQLNKRDLADAVPAAELGAELNELGAPTFEAVAVSGEGVMPTLRQLASMVLGKLNDQRSRRPGPRPAPVQEQPAPTAAPVAAAGAPAAPTATSGPGARSAPSERRAERVAEPVVGRDVSAAAPARSKPEPARAASRVTAPKEPAVKVAGAKAAPAAREVGRVVRGATRVTPGAAAGEPASAARPVAGGPGRRPRFTLADTSRRAPSRKMALVIIGVLAIVVVVVLVLLMRGR
jgi:signal recognition particle receptor subunit beta